MNKKYTRYLYSHFPKLNDFKVNLERNFRRHLVIPTETDHKIFKFFSQLSDELFLDIGANVGQTIDAVRMHAWDCMIQSFEPNPELCTDLNNAYSKDKKLSIHNIALAEKQGSMDLFVPFYREMSFSGLASLDRNKAVNWLNKNNIFNFDPSLLSVRSYHVKTNTLDSFELRPYFIKIDVQGFEENVLKGSLQTIDAARPIFMIETPQKEKEVALLEALGYGAYKFNGEYLELWNQNSLNTFFVPEERVPDLPILIK